MADGRGQRQEWGIYVAHASPGRVRLRAAGSDFAPALDAIATQLRQLEGVCEVGQNQKTGSLTVTFDSLALSLPELLAAIEGWGAAPAATLQAQGNQTDPFAAWKSAEFWKKQGRSFLPVIAGLLAARGLGLVGWRALLAYMIAANTARQLFDQLDKATPATAASPQMPPPAKPAQIMEQIQAATAVGEIARSENFSPSLPPPPPTPQQERGRVRELKEKFSFFGGADLWDSEPHPPTPSPHAGRGSKREFSMSGKSFNHPSTVQRPFFGGAPAPSAVASGAAIAFSIAHAIPGRVRFHVPEIAADPQYARRLQKLAESVAGVTLVRVNSTAASIAISYDAGAVSDAEIRSHLAELIQEASTPKAPGHTATPPPPPIPEAPCEPVESPLAVSMVEMETEPAYNAPVGSQLAVSDAEMEIEPPNSAPVEVCPHSVPVGEAQLEAAPANSAPVESPGAGGAEIEAAPANSAPVESPGAGGAEIEAAPANSAPVEDCPHPVPVGEAQLEVAPANSAPVEVCPHSVPVGEAQLETEPANSAPVESPGAGGAEIEAAPANSAPVEVCPHSVPVGEAQLEVAPANSAPVESLLVISAAEIEIERAPCEPALSAASMETERATDSLPASELSVAEEVNFWLCLWQTFRSTVRGLRAGQPPADALISGLRDAGAISVRG
jgi:copper chaperone CopZ